MASAMDDIWVHSGNDDIHCCVRGCGVPAHVPHFFSRLGWGFLGCYFNGKAVKVSVIFLCSLCDSFCNDLYIFAQKRFSRTPISRPCRFSLSCRALFINLFHFQSSVDVLLIFGRFLEFLLGSVQICTDSHRNIFPKLQLGDVLNFFQQLSTTIFNFKTLVTTNLFSINP